MQLEVKDGIKIEIRNKDCVMGCYDSEDDWSIEVVAPTYEEAIKQIIPKYIESCIYPFSSDVFLVKYVTYKRKHCVLEEYEEIAKSIYGVIDDIKNHPLFEKLSEERHRLAEALMRENQKKQKIANENSERKLLEKLKKKYDK